MTSVIVSAMQKKPEGESRTPTDLWSGMGFSKSMPDTAIRERLARQLQSMQLANTAMTTTYEACIDTYARLVFLAVLGDGQNCTQTNT